MTRIWTSNWMWTKNVYALLYSIISLLVTVTERATSAISSNRRMEEDLLVRDKRDLNDITEEQSRVRNNHNLFDIILPVYANNHADVVMRGLGWYISLHNCQFLAFQWIWTNQSRSCFSPKIINCQFNLNCYWIWQEHDVAHHFPETVPNPHLALPTPHKLNRSL